MSTLVTKDWTAGTGALPSSWSTASGNNPLDVVSGSVRADDDPDLSYRNDVTPPNDQWGQVTLGSTLMTSADNGIGPAIRQATGADTSYRTLSNTVDDLRVYKVVTGTYTLILGPTNIGTLATGDTIYLEAQGTAIVLKRNGSTASSTTDSAITAGRIGIFGANEGAVNPTVSDFSGGDFDAAAGQPTIKRFGGIPHAANLTPRGSVGIAVWMERIRHKLWMYQGAPCGSLSV